MAEGGDWHQDWPTPALMRAARDVYRTAIRGALIDSGFGDMPRDGAYVIGGMARTGAPMSEVIKKMGASKQSAGQLVDTLVTRRYLERDVDPSDRRRLKISLTERGTAAANVVRSMVENVDAQIVAQVGQEHFDHMLATLGSITALGPEAADPG